MLSQSLTPTIASVMPPQTEPKTGSDPTVSNPSKLEEAHIYNGLGTEEEPFLVEFWKDDPANPMNWAQSRKWFIAAIVNSSVFAVTFTSSAYSESAIQVMQEFDISTEVFIVGISLFVLGFAIGPVLWAPLVSACHAWSLLLGYTS
jgi:hypothetical protein